jgi:response regulator RpfG family c-di-GMP phosphodiesterase
MNETAFRPEDITVLIVDDERENVELHARTLRGYRLLVAFSGDEAVTLIAENRVDVIVSDQRMPGTSGPMVLDRARLVNPLVRRIIVSAFADVAGLLEAINLGKAERYLLKPIDPTVLRREVDALAMEHVKVAAEHAEVARLEEQLARLRRAEANKAEHGSGGSRLRVEIARAQRYNRPFALVVGEKHSNLASRFGPHIREVDVVVQMGDDLIVAMPETTREGADAVRRRFADAFPGVVFRLAAFPEDGVDLRALIGAAR